jgi:hypothetical protein
MWFSESVAHATLTGTAYSKQLTSYILIFKPMAGLPPHICMQYGMNENARKVF